MWTQYTGLFVFVNESFNLRVYRLADATGVDPNSVEDMVLGDEKVKKNILLIKVEYYFNRFKFIIKFDQIENFFQMNGRKILMFYYQEVKVNHF